MSDKTKTLRAFGYRIGEISFSPGVALAFHQFSEHPGLQIWLFYPNLYLTLPKLLHREPPMGEMMHSWGFSWLWGRYDLGRDLHLNWGGKYKIIHMPWDFVHVRHSQLMADGAWRDAPRSPRLNESREALDKYTATKEADIFVESHPYVYTLKSGTEQKRTATIKVDEREWRWRWFKWLPLTKKVSRCIDVTFSDEVGERSGSWKGGCLGCGYEMRDGETPLMTLRRMERERKF